jgi:hypothetical protein
MNNSTKEIETLENRFIKLTTLQCALESADKVSYEIALEAENLVPGKSILDRYFSGIGAVEHKKITMESFSGELWLIIIAAIAAAIAAVVGLIKLFKGDSGSGSSGGSSGGVSFSESSNNSNATITITDKKQTSASKVKARVSIENEVVAEVTSTITPSKVKVTTTDRSAPVRLVSKDIDKLRLQYERFSDKSIDVMTNGDYSKAMIQLAALMNNEDPQITLERYAKDMLGSYPAIITEAIDFDDNNNGERLSDFKDRHRTYLENETSASNTKFIEFKEAMNGVYEAIDTLKSANPSSSELGDYPNPVKLLGKVTSARKAIYSEGITSKRESNISHLTATMACLEAAEKHVNEYRVDNSTAGHAERWVGNVFFGRIKETMTRVAQVHSMFLLYNNFEKDLAATAENIFIVMDLTLTESYSANPDGISSEKLLSLKKSIAKCLKDYR